MPLRERGRYRPTTISREMIGWEEGEGIRHRGEGIGHRASGIRGRHRALGSSADGGGWWRRWVRLWLLLWGLAGLYWIVEVG